MRNFAFLVDDDRYSVPTLTLVTTTDEVRAREIAQRILRDSAHHRGVEVCEDERRLFGIGSQADAVRPSSDSPLQARVGEGGSPPA